MFSQHEGDSDRIGFDMTFLLSMGFVMIIILLIMIINDQNSEQQDSRNQGEMLVEMFWGDNLDCDLDLWVMAPHDTPVGYNNSMGRTFNLLRDDLGEEYSTAGSVQLGSSGYGDLSNRNMEMAVGRNLDPGEYVINAHLFGLDGESIPVDFRVVVSMREHSSGGGKMRQLMAITGELTFTGQERTVVRFELDENGEFVPESVHHTQKKLRSAGHSP